MKDEWKRKLPDFVSNTLSSRCFKVTCILLFITSFTYTMYINIPSHYHVVYTSGRNHVFEYSQRHFIDKSQKLVLLWTTFHFDMDWVDHVQKMFKTVCTCNCSVTSDRTRIKEADAVIFHLIDMFIWDKPPKYRAPHQVWVVFTAEPPPHHFYTGRTFVYPRFIFNWTMSYRKDATITAPYGHVERLPPNEEAEMRKNLNGKNYAAGKTKMTFGIISNCVDDARRFWFVKSLRKYSPFDLYGRCGNLTCYRGAGGCEKELTSYRFTMAAENSNCKYYLSEKYYVALSRVKIPLVNWIPEQVPDDAIPNSYINIKDFKSVKALAKYLDYLSKNDSAYNSYFEWRKTHKVVFGHGYLHQYCVLCDALHNSSIPAQVVDYQSYFSDDTCKEWSISSVFTRRLSNYFGIDLF